MKLELTFQQFKEMLHKVMSTTFQETSNAFAKARAERRVTANLPDYAMSYKNYRKRVNDLKVDVLNDLLKEYGLTLEEWNRNFKYYTSKYSDTVKDLREELTAKSWIQPTKEVDKATLIKVFDSQSDYVKNHFEMLQDFKKYADSKQDWVVLVQNKLYDHIAEVYGIENEDMERSFPDLAAAELKADPEFAQAKEKFNEAFRMIFDPTN
mmetsp:Transcript_56765/g.65039  ORF Transcript_56765/g.65039 Transcript_56765/m.65039 type:complete len:209 (-) Transcript_56765:90-716(-)